MEMKKLYLSKKDKKIFGVCGGIGETYDIDPTMIRLILLFSCLLTAIIPGILTYLAAWIIIPENPAEQASVAKPAAGKTGRVKNERRKPKKEKADSS